MKNRPGWVLSKRRSPESGRNTQIPGGTWRWSRRPASIKRLYIRLHILKDWSCKNLGDALKRVLFESFLEAKHILKPIKGMAMPGGIICYTGMFCRVMLITSIMGIYIIEVVVMRYDVVPDIYQYQASK